MPDIDNGVSELLEYRIEELHVGHKDHEKRIAQLETNYMEMKQEFLYVKKELSDHKALTLEIGMKSQEKTDKLFNQLLDSQQANFKTVIDMQTNKSNNHVEVTKKKLLLYGTLITALSGVITALINVIFK